MLDKHREVLKLIAPAFGRHGIGWGLGGSSLLSVYGLADRPPNDLDLLEWYILYLLIPGKSAKADAIERCWGSNRHPQSSFSDKR